MVTVVAGLRRGESKTKNRKDNHGFDGNSAWDIEVEGAAAEMAYCKLRNKYWTGSVNSFKGADQGKNVQIRHTSIKTGSLIVRPEDNPEHYYVLVTGKAPNLVVRGWIKGSEAMRSEFLKEPNGRKGAYFVPQSSLSIFPEMNTVPH